MKLFRRCVLSVLALFVGIVCGYLLISGLVDHRSPMAEFTDLVLILQRRSDKFTYVDAAEAYIAEKAEENKAPVEIKKAKFGVTVREEREEALQAFIFNDQEHPAQTVFYFPGGAYINAPNAQQTNMAARTAKETGSEVVLMAYPREPVYNCADAYEMCTAFYQRYIAEYDCGKIVFMGDSAGGGLALGLAETLRDKGAAAPEELILISPWVDLRMDNPEMALYEEHDPMLGIAGLRRMGEVWADGLPLDDARVSPICGKLAGLGRVTLTTGTWEILYPDTLALARAFEDAGVDCRLVIGENMIHCYPICPIPEAKAAQTVIWSAITR